VVSGEWSEVTTHHSPLTTQQPKITDFGLAKNLDMPQGQTQSGEILGTPSYMAPEQASGRLGTIGRAADIYALGAILYEMLTGRPPFVGETVLDALQQLQFAEPVPPGGLQPKVPRDLETICLKCLRKEPARRYASALALADDLRRFLAGEPVVARPVGIRERTWKWARRRPALAALYATLAVAGVGMFTLSLAYNAALYQGAMQREKEERRLAGLGVEGRKLIDAGQDALSRQRDWQKARVQFAQAMALADSEPSLADLKAHAADLLKRTSRLLDEELSRKQAQERYRRFLQLRDETLFHGMQYVGVDLPANLQRTKRTAEDALRLVGATAKDRAPLDWSTRAWRFLRSAGTRGGRR
jgi:hypothetical protein